MTIWQDPFHIQRDVRPSFIRGYDLIILLLSHWNFGVHMVLEQYSVVLSCFNITQLTNLHQINLA